MGVLLFLRMRLATLALGLIVGTVFASVIALAWTGPTSPPPAGNVAAPLNVGTSDQIKNAGLGINSLAVFGNAILSGTSRYLNFGSTAGSSGFGIRDNTGTMEFKNSGGAWSSITSSIQSFFSAGNTISQIKFADGTTQTTAVTSGGISSVTNASCSLSSPRWGEPSSCSVDCPAGYYLTACASTYAGTTYYPTNAYPSGNGCACSSSSSGGATCYAYCAK